jgi:tetratricopeptide (TPR) repeat protein
MKTAVRLPRPLLIELVLFLATQVTLLGTAAPAWAQTATDQARVEFKRGAEAYQEARYEDAIEAFTRAYELDAKPTLLYNIAQAYERLGDVPSALRAYRDFLRADSPEQDRKLVETRIRNLERRLRARGLQQVSIFSDPPGAGVTLDGERVGETPWTGEVKPGRHVAMLERSDYAQTTKDFVLGPERAVDLNIVLSRASGVKSQTGGRDVGSASGTEAAGGDRKGAKVAPWTWAALGVGAVALGAAAGFELARRSAESDAETATTQLDHQSAFEDMESRQTTARILLAVGAAAEVAGGVLLYLDLSSSEGSPSASHARLGIGCASGGCGLVSKGRF